MTPRVLAIQKIKELGASLSPKDYANYLQEVFDEVEMLLDAAQQCAEREDDEAANHG